MGHIVVWPSASLEIVGDFLRMRDRGSEPTAAATRRPISERLGLDLRSIALIRSWSEEIPFSTAVHSGQHPFVLRHTCHLQACQRRLRRPFAALANNARYEPAAAATLVPPTRPTTSNIALKTGTAKSRLLPQVGHRGCWAFNFDAGSYSRRVH
jgi:hypothetical protein